MEAYAVKTKNNRKSLVSDHSPVLPTLPGSFYNSRTLRMPRGTVLQWHVKMLSKWPLLSIISLRILTATTQSTYPNTTSPTCTTPTGFANTVVFAPDALASRNHRIETTFEYTHAIYFNELFNTDLPQATIASYCLDQCVAYKGNATSNLPCLSFSVDMGAPYPPNASDTVVRWFCTAFDAPLSPDLYELIDADSYMHAVGVNRVCEGTFRAY